MLSAILPLTFVNFATCPLKFTISMPLIVEKVSIVFSSIWPGHDPFSWYFVFPPFTYIFTLIQPCSSSTSLNYAMAKVSLKFWSIRIHQLSASMEEVIFPAAFSYVLVCVQHKTSKVSLSILPQSFISAKIRIFHSTIAVPLVIVKLASICIITYVMIRYPIIVFIVARNYAISIDNSIFLNCLAS